MFILDFYLSFRTVSGKIYLTCVNFDNVKVYPSGVKFDNVKVYPSSGYTLLYGANCNQLATILLLLPTF